MKCKWNKCDNEARKKSPFCSGTCKKRHARQVGQVSETSVPVDEEVGQTAIPKPELPVSVTVAARSAIEALEPKGINTELLGTASLEEYYRDADNQIYAPKSHPDRLNWGEPMNIEELRHAGLTANRIAVPGDWDYSGVCRGVDGVWAA